MSMEKIAQFIATTRYDDIPPEAIDIAKMCIFDGFGVALAGIRENTSRVILEHVKENGGTPQSHVIGSSLKTNAPLAALANGTLAHALDFDDHAITWTGHPTIVLMPSVIALAEKEGMNGRDVLTAYSVGWEVGSKICDALANLLFENGWHPTATAGTLAATAACANLLGMDVEQILCALGIAASEASGLRYNFGTDTKPLHAGLAARNGINAALLAQKGFTAGQTVLEGDLGFCKVFAGKELDLKATAAALGSPYDIMTSYSIKPFPSCGLTHRCIDAMLTLVKENTFTPEEVERIECHTPPMVRDILVYSKPKSGLQGKFSLEYCMAAVIVDKELSLRQFTDEKVTAPVARELTAKVALNFLDVNKGQSLLNIPQAVKVILKDGRELFEEVQWPKGYAHNPMTWLEVTHKFTDCAESVLTPDNIAQCIDKAADFENVPSIAEFMQILSTK